MRLQYLTQDTLDDLKNNFDTYKKHYANNDKQWFADYFTASNGLLDSKIECENFSLITSGDFETTDLENIKALYSSLKDLSVVNATDERLWAGLSHNLFWDYIQYRRNDELKSKDTKKIKDSFFFRYGPKRSSHVHCLSRLWWAGHLTYDKSRKNPFELTEFLCKSAFASRILLLSSYNYNSNHNLSLGILTGLYEWEKHSGLEIKREHFVDVIKYFNFIGSVKILDFYSKDEVLTLTLKHLNKHYK